MADDGYNNMMMIIGEKKGFDEEFFGKFEIYKRFCIKAEEKTQKQPNGEITRFREWWVISPTPKSLENYHIVEVRYTESTGLVEEEYIKARMLTLDDVKLEVSLRDLEEFILFCRAFENPLTDIFRGMIERIKAANAERERLALESRARCEKKKHLGYKYCCEDCKCKKCDAARTCKYCKQILEKIIKEEKKA